MHLTIDIIHREHNALASVLNGLRSIVAGIREGRLEADFVLLAAMLVYIAEVPEKVHHPKEDGFLFSKLRERASSAGALLDALEEEHRQGYRLTRELEHSLIHYLGMGAAGFAQFDETLARYLDFSWQHINREENELMPIALSELKAEDWAEIDSAFSENHDPWSGPEGEYAALFSKIVNLAPSPLGVGPAGKARG